MEYGKISFKDLKEGNHEFNPDVDAVVLVGVGIDVNTDDPKEVGEVLSTELRDCGFVTNDAQVSKALRITGNVRGDEGRWDWVLVFDKNPNFNCIKRFATPWKVSWVCDFVPNYGDDFDCD